MPNDSTSRQYGIPRLLIPYSDANFRYLLGNITDDLKNMYSQHYTVTDVLKVVIKRKPVTATHLFGYKYELYHGMKRILTLSITDHNYYHRDFIRRFREDRKPGYIFVQGRATYLHNLWDVYVRTRTADIERYTEDCWQFTNA